MVEMGEGSHELFRKGVVGREEELPRIAKIGRGGIPMNVFVLLLVIMNLQLTVKLSIYLMASANSESYLYIVAPLDLERGK